MNTRPTLAASAQLIIARAEIDRLRAIIEPFAAAVCNDNGDVTYTTDHIKTDDYWHAYMALKPGNK